MSETSLLSTDNICLCGQLKLCKLFVWIVALDTWGVVGWCEGVMYHMSTGHPTDIGLQLGKVCYPCHRKG